MSDTNEGEIKRLDRLVKESALEPWPELQEVLLLPTSESSAGFPYLAELGFEKFLARIPHLFTDGLKLFSWLDRIRLQVASEELTDLARSVKVLQTITYTAAVTSPCDLWVLRQVWSLYKKMDLLKSLECKKPLTPRAFAKVHGLCARHVAIDFGLLYSRGYLFKNEEGYRLSECAQTRDVISHLPRLMPGLPGNLVPIIANVLKGRGSIYEKQTAERFFAIDIIGRVYDNWIAGPDQLQIGMCIVPLHLALRSLNINSKLVSGENLKSTVGGLTAPMLEVLSRAGHCDKNNQITNLGARVFARGSGPFGIIHAYHSYFAHLDDLLKGETVSSWVARGENVEASQDANRRSFKMANDALDRFCRDHKFTFTVFIEHAVGQGEATRQRFARDGEARISYFGADLEDAAIDKALLAQQQGELPKNMQFIRGADIGRPEIVVCGIKASELATKNAVMIVGNGFHEVRQQTNEKMVSVLKGYCEAGILLIFTEESALSDSDLLATGWNTYHAGFRYVHELSGQGLRPALEKKNGDQKAGPSGDRSRYSWRKCASLAGYRVLEEYTTKTRTIFPSPKASGYNPSISVSYFCVPEQLIKDGAILNPCHEIA